MPAADPRDARDPVGGGILPAALAASGVRHAADDAGALPGAAAPCRSASRTGMLIRGPVSLPVAW
ncbi:hypothetical protein ACWC9F_11130 [Streptomyces sp. NPDC001110]|uniref:hypothetical protein n=1 Tax=Streptomyces TaxID=1883 RepID=UPI001370972D|nr:MULTISPECIES: hypothetical protein [unclassified Streptomyces]MYT57552.1 hypothetical protein [Streptomyces sp. SID7834]WKV77138.1 hypothetical protein HBB06_02835 [Streptomyces sp. SNU607]